MFKRFSWLLAGAEQADQPQTSTPRNRCEQRGYCGPFVNQTYFNSLEAWVGFGMCVECGRVVPVPRGERSLASLDRWPAEPPPSHPARLAF